MRLPADTSVAERDLAVDFYRVSGVFLIVVGHWLAACVTYHDGYFGRQNPLVDQPWTQWLTWPFQAVPVFFLVAGYAAAVSWTQRHETDGIPRQAWLRHRLARVLGPTAVYLGLVSAVVVISEFYGVDRYLLEYAGWAVAMHLWFLAVYVVVVSLTPVAVAAQRRWGLLVPAVLAVGVAGVDAASIGGHVHHLGPLNYLLCWGAFYQLGIAWRSGSLAGWRPLLLAVVSGGALALLIRVAQYPVSMIGVPGQDVQNTTPPSVAMLAFGCAQAGIAIALAPLLNRLFRVGFTQRTLSVANNNIMALYLWHMIPVVIVAVLGYPAGLLAQPPEGTGQWWLARLQWVAILVCLTAVEMALLWWGRRVFAGPLPTFGVPVAAAWAEPMLLIGALLTSYGLDRIAADGFAPDGHFPSVTALAFGIGLVLVAFRSSRVNRPSCNAGVGSQPNLP